VAPLPRKISEEKEGEEMGKQPLIIAVVISVLLLLWFAPTVDTCTLVHISVTEKVTIVQRQVNVIHHDHAYAMVRSPVGQTTEDLRSTR
jgi:hypothetical protein